MRKYISALLMAASVLSLSGCILNEMKTGGGGGDRNDVDVVLRLRTPGSFSAPRTRALTYADENTIASIHVLVFDRETGKLTTVKAGEDVTDETGSMTSPSGDYSGGGSFSVTLKPSMGVEMSKLVVLANFDTSVIAALEAAAASASKPTYAQVMEAATFDANTPLFLSGPFPMWGETDYIAITSTGKNISVELMRPVARIDVGVSRNPLNDPATDNWTWDGKNAGVDIPFDLTEVYVIRPTDHYSVIPDPLFVTNLNTNGSVTAPTIPALAANIPAGTSETAFAYTGITASHYITRTIYVPESDIIMDAASPAPGDANHKERMALVVGGIYNGGPATTYYRLDFASTAGLMNVLRNNLYQFNISKVSGPGYATVQQAYEANAMNMTVEVLHWDETAFENIWVVGSNYFSLLDQEIEFTPQAGEVRNVAIKTNITDFSIIIDGSPELDGNGKTTFDSGNFTYTLSKTGGDIYTLRIETNNANISAGGAPLSDNWTFDIGIIDAIPFTVTQQHSAGYISMPDGLSKRFFPEGSNGETIPVEILSSVPVSVDISPSSASAWIEGVVTPTLSGGIYEASMNIGVKPFKYGASYGGTTNRSATVTITPQSGSPRTLAITQEMPYLLFDLADIRLDSPSPAGEVTRPVAIQTNIPLEHLDFGFTDVTGITHTAPAVIGIAKYPRYAAFDIEVDTSVPSFVSSTTFSVAPKTPSASIPDYGLSAQNGSITLRASTEVFNFRWKRGAFIGNPTPWTPVSDGEKERMDYIFPWNATNVEFEIETNSEITDDTAPAGLGGGTLSEGPAGTVAGVSVVPYTFSFNNLDYGTPRTFALRFTPEQGAPMPVTFSQGAQSWTAGTVAAQSYAGTGASGDSFVALDVTSNIEWTATAGETWMKLSKTGSGFSSQVSRRDHITTPVATSAELVKSGNINVHIDPIATLNPFAVSIAPADYKRTGIISFSNEDNSGGGLSLLENAISVTQWAPMLLSSGTTLPLSPGKIPMAGATYTITATTNLSGWGVKVYSDMLDNGTSAPGSLIVQKASGSSLTASAQAVASDVSVTIGAYAGVSERALRFVLYCDEFPGTAGEVEIGTWTQTVVASISVAPPTLSFGADDDAGSAGQTVNVTSNVDWQVEKSGANAADFIVTPSSGTYNDTFTVKAGSRNTTTAPRAATIKVVAKDDPTKYAIISVSQAASASIEVNPASVSFLAADGSSIDKTVEVTANVNWTARLDDDTYFELTNAGGTANVNSSFTVSPKGTNGTTVPRTAKVTVSGGGTDTEVAITQAAALPALSVPTAARTWTASQSGNTAGVYVEIAVTSNAPWSVSVPEGFTANPATGSGNGSFRIYPSGTNGGLTDKTGTVTVSTTHGTNDTSSGFTVTQAGVPPTLTLTPAETPEWTGDQYGDTSAKNIAVASNAPWSATAPANFTLKNTTTGATGGTVTGSGNATLQVYPSSVNENTDRTGDVTVETTAGSPQVSATVSVKQAKTPIPYSEEVTIGGTTWAAANAGGGDATTYGVLWQWGRNDTSYTAGVPTDVPAAYTGDPWVDLPCPAGYTVPTNAQLWALIGGSYTTMRKVTTVYGIYGMEFTVTAGPDTGKSLFFPYSGYVHSYDDPNTRIGEAVLYWAAESTGADRTGANVLFMDNNNPGILTASKKPARPLRCVKK